VAIEKVLYTVPVPKSASFFTRAGIRHARFKHRGRQIEVPLSENGKRCTLETPEWYVRYKDAKGKWKREKGYTDRRLTEDLQDRILLRIAGEKGDPFAEHRGRPLSEHIDDFEAGLVAKQWNDQHISQVAGHVRGAFTKTEYSFRAGKAKRIIAGCNFQKLADIDAHRVQVFLGDLVGAGASHQTYNHYLSDFREFCNWLVDYHRTLYNPLAQLRPLNVDVDRRRVRRAISPEEIGWLLRTAAKSEWCYRGLAGIDRFVIYYLTLGTGLRAAEVASLRPESFDLEQPLFRTVTVEAKRSKRRQRDEIPLAPDVANIMAEYLEDRPAEELLWPGCWPDRAAEMMEHDLAEAKAAWIKEAPSDEEATKRLKSDFLAYQNKAGEYADFHAQRHTYATVVYRVLPSKMGRDLVRHSTESLADRYTHIHASDRGGAAASLPPILPPEDSTIQRQLATGTDGRAAVRGTATKRPRKEAPAEDRPDVISIGPAREPLQNLATGRVAGGHVGARGGTQQGTVETGPKKSQTIGGKAESVSSKADGARFERALESPPEQFRTLPLEARRWLGPLFWLHGDESRQRLESYVDKVAEGGNGCFTTESRPHVDWLGEGWWRDRGRTTRASRAGSDSASPPGASRSAGTPCAVKSPPYLTGGCGRTKSSLS
jgi:site-specific recombinase XerC